MRWLAATAAALLLAACAVPLGPGFFRRSERLEARYAAPGDGGEARLEVRAFFELANAGSRPLEFLDVALPSNAVFGRSGLRVVFAGNEIPPTPAPRELPAPPGEAARTQVVEILRLELPASWREKEVRTLEIRYALAPAPASGAVLAPEALVLPPRDWFPVLLAPRGLFAKGDAPPRRRELAVIAPADFLVHASGAARGARRLRAGAAGATTEREFLFRISERDFPPFVLAGRWSEQRYSDSQGTTLFWHAEPFAADALNRAGARLAGTLHFLESRLGPRAPRRRPLRVAEVALAPNTRELPIPAYFAMPEAVVVLRTGSGAPLMADESGVESAERMLALTWFAHVARPRAEEPLPLLPGIAEFCSRAAAEARGGGIPRGELARGQLRSFDATRSAEIKSALMLMALEERIGQGHLFAALRRMAQGLRGSEYGIVDLRAAAENETRQDLGDFFRAWLAQDGVPEEFRRRAAAH
jgi:hypothetical protein